jgi:hypothetical protein
VALALLIGITHAATFSFVHSHGSVSPGHYSNQVAGVGEKANLSDNTKFHSQAHNQSCLICVLQQQLFSSALEKAISAQARPSVQLAQLPPGVASYFSISASPQRGRAPPPAFQL